MEAGNPLQGMRIASSKQKELRVWNYAAENVPFV